MPQLEIVPAEEAAQIDNIVRLTAAQMEQRYPGGAGARRGQHAKAHACVEATFTIREDLPPAMRAGLFATPGRQYQAWVRYSNAAAKAGSDSPLVGGMATHGSRGMAIKIMGVSGTPLIPGDDAATQDFLLVNHPAFPFANVEDYNALSEVLGKTIDNPNAFFARRKGTNEARDLEDPVSRRAWRTFDMVRRIQSLSVDADPAALQAPPASPVDTTYFGGAPFLFGDERVMRIAARPAAPSPAAPSDLAGEHYLRAALRERLTGRDAREVVFAFEIQVRTAADLARTIATDIEDASAEWNPETHRFEQVATITIAPQEFETAEREALCESLFFTPWHGVVEHRPLGGINRLRRAVYDASVKFRQPRRSIAAV